MTNMACGEPRIAGDKTSQLEKYVVDGNEIVEFKLVRDPSDVKDEEKSFKPEMCHQIFNEQERIFGYENLKVQLYFSAGSLDPYLGMDYKSKVPPTLAEGVEPDNVLEGLETVLRFPYTTNLDDFMAKFEKTEANFKPLGELVHSFNNSYEPPQKTPQKLKSNGHSVSPKQNGHHAAPRTFEIYHCDVSLPKFRDYLIRMESFIMWFIDAASFVDEDDEKWKFFVMYEKYKSSEGSTRYAFAGYSAVYNFYCYPDMVRPRVAQMLILPPFQRRGLAVELLSTIYTFYRKNPKVKEITIEDPSDDFERLRDFVDARDCSKLSSYSPGNLKQGFSTGMAEEAKTKLKMTTRQARRVYEMLRLKVTNVHNENELREYRLDVKRRLNIPYQKQQSDMKRMMRRKFNSTEIQTAAQLDDATRKTELESNFQLLLSHYQYVVNRLERES